VGQTHLTRLEHLLAKLQKHYGPLPEPPADAFVLLVWEALSWHSTPEKRDAALKALERLRALTPDAMGRAPRAKLDAIVAAAGPYTLQRIQALRRVVETFRERPDLPAILKGPMPAALKSLKGLTQMGGDSGAYRMLLFAGDHPVLPVNASVERTARRLGYGEGVARDFKQSAKIVRDAVAPELPATSAAYRTAYVYLAHHGATICKQADPDCPICPVKAECPGRKAIIAGIADS
jgi:endonuclease III